MRAHNIRIFCDFDGTIATEDIGDKFFVTFAGENMWTDNALYKEGNISGEELYRRNAAKISGITEEQVDRFCADRRIDPTFGEFAAWCEDSGHPLMILSDGFDIYIDRLLARENLDLPKRCNTMRIVDGHVELEFPHSYPDCECAANCKRNALALNSADEDYIVYIGDGYSDFCPAKYADMVFAKDALETHCQEQNITFRRFHSFTDVREGIESLAARNNLRHRNRAAQLRKQLWLGG
ncbi:MAG: hypothetical protein CL946_12535 [Ectothiorhodospiraceae bacterium]|nr:hypothetical protein [Ectothiorhodospiraceae bacterium]